MAATGVPQPPRLRSADELNQKLAPFPVAGGQPGPNRVVPMVTSPDGLSRSQQSCQHAAANRRQAPSIMRLAAAPGDTGLESSGGGSVKVMSAGAGPVVGQAVMYGSQVRPSSTPTTSGQPPVIESQPTAAMRAWVAGLLQEQMNMVEQTFGAKLTSLGEFLEQRLASSVSAGAPETVHASMEQTTSLREDLVKMAQAVSHMDMRFGQFSAKLDLTNSQMRKLQESSRNTTVSVNNDSLSTAQAQALADLTDLVAGMHQNVELLEARIEAVQDDLPAATEVQTASSAHLQLRIETLEARIETIPSQPAQAADVQPGSADVGRLENLEDLCTALGQELSQIQTRMKEHVEEIRGELALERQASSREVESIKQLLEASSSSLQQQLTESSVPASPSGDQPGQMAALKELIQAYVSPLQDQLQQVLGDMDAIQSAVEAQTAQAEEMWVPKKEHEMLTLKHGLLTDDMVALKSSARLQREVSQAQEDRLEQMGAKEAEELDSLQSQLVSLQSLMQASQSQSESSCETSEACQAQLTTLQDDVKAEALQLEKLQGRLETSHSNAETARAHYEEMEKIWTSHFSDLQKHTEAQTELARVERQAASTTYRLEMDGLKETVESLQTHADEGKVRLAEREARIDVMCEEINQIDRRSLEAGSSLERTLAEARLTTGNPNTILQGEVNAMAAKQAESQASILALRSQIEVARERHSEIDSMKSKLTEVLVVFEEVHAQNVRLNGHTNELTELRQTLEQHQQRIDSSEVGPTTLYGHFLRSEIESGDGHSCADSTASGLESQHQSFMNSLQARLVALETTGSALREQLEANMREDTARGDEDVLERFEVLQSRVTGLTSEHSITRSNVKETSVAIRQMAEMLPDRRDFCSHTQLEATLQQKMSEIHDESHSRFALLSSTLTQELGVSLSAQMNKQARSVVNTELAGLRKQLLMNTEKLWMLEKGIPEVPLPDEFSDADNAFLPRLLHALKQVNSDQTTLRSEVDLLQSLHKLTGTNNEELQERFKMLESRTSVGQVLLDPATSEGQMFEASVQGALDAVRADVETSHLRLDEFARCLLSAGEVHKQEIWSVSEGIKEYIASLIVRMDPPDTFQSSAHSYEGSNCSAIFEGAPSTPSSMPGSRALRSASVPPMGALASPSVAGSRPTSGSRTATPWNNVALSGLGSQGNGSGLLPVGAPTRHVVPPGAVAAGASLRAMSPASSAISGQPNPALRSQSSHSGYYR